MHHLRASLSLSGSDLWVLMVPPMRRQIQTSSLAHAGEIIDPGSETLPRSRLETMSAISSLMPQTDRHSLLAWAMAMASQLVLVEWLSAVHGALAQHLVSLPVALSEVSRQHRPLVDWPHLAGRVATDCVWTQILCDASISVSEFSNLQAHLLIASLTSLIGHSKPCIEHASLST